jgi:hypothetical protein
MRRPDPSVEAGEEAGPAICPYCGSEDTRQEHPRGPSRCRSIHYCDGCDQPFEAMG